MDGKTIQRMRLLEKRAVELEMQNKHLSASALEMADRLDRATRSGLIDRLMSAALIAELGAKGVVHLPIPNVDAMRMAMAAEPGVAIHVSKDEVLGVWILEVKENPPAARNVYNCSACRKDHVDIPQRDVTEAERGRGVAWVGICPETQRDVFAFAERPKEEPKLIELAR